MANKKKKAEVLENQTTQKKPIKKSFIIKLSAIILAVVFFFACIGVVVNSYAPANPKDYHRWFLSGIFGSYDKEGNPETYWAVEKTKSGNNELMVYSEISVSGSYKNINELWLNLSDFYETETEIVVINGSSRTVNKYKLTATDLKANQNGWVKIYDLEDATASNDDDYENVTSTKFFIGFKTKINVRELVVTNADGKTIDYEVKGIKIDNQSISIEDENVKNAENPVSNLNDEQKLFTRE